MTAGHGTALVHRAFVYSGDQEFLDAALPFVRAGLGADEVVLVAAPPPRLDLLRPALGADADPVLFVDVGEWYRHPVHTIAAYDGFLRANAPRRVRALAEPQWAGRSPLEIGEWVRYEAVVNAVFGRWAANALCAYDLNAAPAGVVDGVHRTHPEMVVGGRPRASVRYTEPVRFSAECDRAPLPPPDGFDSIPIESADLHGVRSFVAARAADHGLPPAAVSRMLIAVTELATNAVKHGAPPMAVRVWSDGGDLCCEIADCGRWRPAALLGYAPPATAADGGFGLWAARMLTDVVQVRAGWDGTVVRLRMRLPGRAG